MRLTQIELQKNIAKSVLSPPSNIRKTHTEVACSVAWRLSACAFRIPLGCIIAKERCARHEAAAWHAAMYIAHVALGVTLVAIGRYFQRDRTTVAYAVRRTEDHRDDPVFDATIAEIGRLARLALRLDGEIEV